MADQIEQYKTYFQDVANFRRRHEQSRHFYLMVVSALLVFIALTGNQGSIVGAHGLVLILAGLAGGILCFLWNADMHAYHAIFKVKVDILRRIEGHYNLFNIFEEEQKILRLNPRYQLMAVLDSLMPLIFSLFFAAVIYLKLRG